MEMVALKYIEQTRAYLDYLEEHIRNVRMAFVEVQDACSDLYDDRFWDNLKFMVEYHDMSKFSSMEFTQYRVHFYPVKGEVPPHPTVDFGLAWEHHKLMNHHHHETAKTEYDVVHMVIDWLAMSHKFNNTPREFYDKNSHKIDLKSSKLEVALQNILDRVCPRG